jgi:hypothetical protein
LRDEKRSICSCHARFYVSPNPGTCLISKKMDPYVFIGVRRRLIGALCYTRIEGHAHLTLEEMGTHDGCAPRPHPCRPGRTSQFTRDLYHLLEFSIFLWGECPLMSFTETRAFPARVVNPFVARCVVPEAVITAPFRSLATARVWQTQ